MYDRYQDWRLDVDNMTYEVCLPSLPCNSTLPRHHHEPILYNRSCLSLEKESDMSTQVYVRTRSFATSGRSSTQPSIPRSGFQQKQKRSAVFVKYAIDLFSLQFPASSFYISILSLVFKPSLIRCMLQEEFEANDEMGRLHCGHSYHVYCIKQWLSQKNVCPVCKTAVTKT